MFCTHCGAQLPEDARFCSRCGKTMQQPSGSNIDFDRLREANTCGSTGALYRHILARLRAFPENARRAGLAPKRLWGGQVIKPLFRAAHTTPEVTGWHLVHDLTTYEYHTDTFDLHIDTTGQLYRNQCPVSAESIAKIIASHGSFLTMGGAQTDAFDQYYTVWLRGHPCDCGVNMTDWHKA
ncbi:MAG: zinc ribbon domain-containing protein [Clostridia bacterium]|nr:zinc ribbon domain-containing protein [Clostridia bacterium]